MIIFCRADKIVSYNGKKYNIFRCIEWKKITSFSYFYYVKQGNLFSQLLDYVYAF